MTHKQEQNGNALINGSIYTAAHHELTRIHGNAIKFFDNINAWPPFDVVVAAVAVDDDDGDDDKMTQSSSVCCGIIFT